ncbi:hypothetical protein CDAR_165511 [Caerostris darwini]|uniref:Uncharacterized protein n=1 Tax=Caerostris darwini TaxID=1538125 RepID=A0AAV4WBA8_9ARAC|nr:hypothetical protein CDAR_165511 [Caerostris darwini]
MTNDSVIDVLERERYLFERECLLKDYRTLTFPSRGGDNKSLPEKVPNGLEMRAKFLQSHTPFHYVTRGMDRVLAMLTFASDEAKMYRLASCLTRAEPVCLVVLEHALSVYEDLP